MYSCRSLLVVLLLIQAPGAIALIVPPTRKHGISSAITTARQRSLMGRLGASRAEVDSARNSRAIETLEALLEQQTSDLHDTETLIELLKSTEDGEHDQEDFLSSIDSETRTTATSLLAGFDYGFQSRSEGQASKLKAGLVLDGLGYGGPPANVLTLGSQQFMRNLDAMKGEYKDEQDVTLTKKQEALQAKLEQLKLNSTEIWEREFADGPVVAPLIIKVPYLAVCFLLDVVFEGRYVPSRFFLLETVARMPYFSYITMLHLYETLGFWRRSSEMKRIHFAEEINEFNHLLIMESLGGDQAWWVRFVAQHSAIVYYIVLCILWAVSPSLSYRFSELLETHAVNTYGVFLDDNEELLKELPPSLAAIEYYSFGITDSFYAEFQTSGAGIRKPGVNMHSLYDVFSAIQADEGDHVKTMKACLDPEANLRAPSLERKLLTGLALVAAVSIFLSAGETSVLDTGVDLAEDVAPTDMAVDAAVAGAAFANKFVVEDEGLLGEGLLEGIRRLGIEAAEALARIIVTLI